MSSRLCVHNFFRPHLLSAVCRLGPGAQLSGGICKRDFSVREMSEGNPNDPKCFTLCHVSTFDQLRINHFVWSVYHTRKSKRQLYYTSIFASSPLMWKDISQLWSWGWGRGCYWSGVPHSGMPQTYGWHCPGRIFFQKVVTFFQLHRLIFHISCIESLASIGFSGQSYRPESRKLIFGPATSC